MSLHDDVELACENAEAWNCTVMDDQGNVGVPVITLRAILARHPAPTVSDGVAEMVEFARQTPYSAWQLAEGTMRFLNAGVTPEMLARVLAPAQLQVQAPVGEHLEECTPEPPPLQSDDSNASDLPTVSDGEREGMANVIASAYGDDLSTECPCAQDFTVADALIAAGYRKAPVVNVEES